MNTLITLVKNIRSLAQPDPARDWIIIMSCSIVVLLGVVVWNVWVFDVIIEDQIINPSVTTTKATSDIPSLEKLHPVLEKRSVEEAKYLSKEYRFIDPAK